MSPRPAASHHRPGSSVRLQVRSGRTEPVPRAGRVVVHGWPVLVVVHDARGDWHLLADHPELSAGTGDDDAHQTVDVSHAVSSITGARPCSGSHHDRLSRYHRTVEARPSAKSTRGA